MFRELSPSDHMKFVTFIGLTGCQKQKRIFSGKLLLYIQMSVMANESMGSFFSHIYEHYIATPLCKLVE